MINLDDLSSLYEGLASDVVFEQGDLTGTCQAWLANQDQAVKAVEGIRLTAGQRDLMVKADTLSRLPREGDRFRIDNQWWTVRPRGEDCFTPGDRKGQLLRVYVIR